MKRIFIALALDDATKAGLDKLQRLISPLIKKGRFVPPSLFHLTLQFLGELEDEEVLRLHAWEPQWVQELSPFSLTINHTGCFQKRNRWVLWAGIENNPDLEQLAALVHASFKKQGFVNHHPFRPHITLAREVQFESVDKRLAYEATKVDLPPVNVDGIHMMESTRLEGKLQYQSLKKYQFGG